ncbi:MAG: thioredoxin family protein [Candidatus Dependentiae bacterium]
MIKKLYIISLLSLMSSVTQAKVIEIDGQQDLDNKLKHPHVVIKFYRPGCPHCRAIESDYKKISDKANKDRKDKIIFLGINTDTKGNQTIYPKWKVNGVPKLFFVKNGQKKEIPRKRDFAQSFEKDIHEHFDSKSQ